MNKSWQKIHGSYAHGKKVLGNLRFATSGAHDCCEIASSRGIWAAWQHVRKNNSFFKTALGFTGGLLVLSVGTLVSKKLKVGTLHGTWLIFFISLLADQPDWWSGSEANYTYISNSGGSDSGKCSCGHTGDEHTLNLTTGWVKCNICGCQYRNDNPSPSIEELQSE